MGFPRNLLEGADQMCWDGIHQPGMQWPSHVIHRESIANPMYRDVIPVVSSFQSDATNTFWSLVRTITTLTN